MVSRKNKTRNRKRKPLNILRPGGQFVTKAKVAAAKKKVESEIDILNKEHRAALAAVTNTYRRELRTQDIRHELKRKLAQLTGKGGGGGKGEGGSSYLKQLGKWEVIREEIAIQMPTRMSQYSRKVMLHGKAYKEVEVLKRDAPVVTVASTIHDKI